MKITRTLASWYEIYVVLKALPPLPNIPLAFSLGTLMDNLTPHIARSDKLRNELIQKLGERGEDSTYRISPENMDEFQKQISDLTELPLEMEFEMFPLAELTVAGTPALSPDQLRTLKPLMKGA